MPDASIFIFIALCTLTAMSGGIFRPGAWYETLDKPSWTPRDWVFPVVWMILYALIAVAGWLVWRAAPGGAAVLPLAIYGVQLFLNASWSAVFFGLRRPDLGMINVALLWLSILAMIVTFYPVSAFAALIMLPYLAWVSIAATLNFVIWRRNPRGGAPADITGAAT